LAAAFPRTDERRQQITNTRNNSHEQKNQKERAMTFPCVDALLSSHGCGREEAHLMRAGAPRRSARRGEDLSGRRRGGGPWGPLGALRGAEGEVRL